MKLAEFDYFLPEERIAQHPLEPRDSSRLMVVDRQSRTLQHRFFRDICEYLHPSDVLVVNDSRVLPARLYGVRQDTGGKIEVLLLTRRDIDHWEVLVKPGRRARPGLKLEFGNGELVAEVLEKTEVGGRVIRFEYDGAFEQVLDRLGQMPLPPYIHETLEDKERYQTVYAREEGSAAAPTAGLHFTEELLSRIRSMGVKIVPVTLHVGLGTFRPVSAETIEEHHMHAEYYKIDQTAANVINEAKGTGRRIVAVGTTSVRTLESAALHSLKSGKTEIVAHDGWTDIFIYPGYSFEAVDALITNFHLPKSSLLMLVSALADRELIMKAYQTAVEMEYRFFSFGDAMFIV